MSDVGGGAGSGSQTDLCPALILTELTRPPGRDSRGRTVITGEESEVLHPGQSPS